MTLERGPRSLLIPANDVGFGVSRAFGEEPNNMRGTIRDGWPEKQSLSFGNTPLIDEAGAANGAPLSLANMRSVAAIAARARQN
jgi:hypothetical protein